jgi:hypothetical protein
LEGSLTIIVKGELKKAALLAVFAPFGHPFAPFVVGKEGGNDEHDSENNEKNLHRGYRIA